MLRLTPVVNLELHDRIKRELRARHVTLRSIADEAGYSLSMASMVSQGHRSSKVIEGLIAAKLGQRPEALWPARYQPDTTGESDT